MKRHLCFAVAILVATALTVSQVQATVLFSDDFEGRTTGSGDGNGNPAGAGNGDSDWGTNNNNLGGSNSAPYVVLDPTPTGGAQQVVGLNQFEALLGNHGHLLNGGVITGYSAAADAPNGFSVAFRFDRNTDPNANASAGGYLAVGVGSDATAGGLGGASAISKTELGVLFQQGANGNAANANVLIDNVATTSFDYLDPAAAHDVLLQIAPQVAGAYNTAGDLIDYRVSVDGNVLATGTFAHSGKPGRDTGIVAFSSNNFAQRYVDNLVISAIPEPTSCLLLAAGSVALLARRRG